MDPNLKEILLVVLGAAGSLLGTVITLFFEMRRDRWSSRMDQKKEDYKELATYLRSIVTFGSTVYSATVNASMGIPVDRRAVYEDFILPAANKVAESPLDGLPPILLSDDKFVIDSLEKLKDFEMSINLAVQAWQSNKQLAPEYLPKFKKELGDMNHLIGQILERTRSY